MKRSSSSLVRHRAPARMLGLAMAVLLSGCLRANRDAPVAPDALWPTYMAEPGNSPFEDERAPTSTPEVVWRADPNRGYASTPVVNGAALISTSTNRMVQGISLETGDIYWEHRKNGPLSVPPVVVGERTFIATSDVEGRIYGIRSRDGRGRWDEDLPGVAQPMVADDTLLLVANVAGRILALRQTNGDVVWRTRLGAGAASPPLPVGDRILVATDADSLLALDRDGGRRLGALGLGGQVSAPPALREGMAYLPLHTAELAAVRASDLRELWRVRADAPILAAPVATTDGRVYILDTSGTVWVVDPGGGLRRLASLGSATRGSLTVTSNAVLVGLLDGRFLALARESGELLWTLDMGDSVYTPALVHQGFIYVPLRRGEIVKLR